MIKVGDKVMFHPHPIAIPIEFEVEEFKTNNKGVQTACNKQWGCFPVNQLKKLK